MRFQAVFALALILGIQGEALCREYRAPQENVDGHIVVFKNRQFDGASRNIDFNGGECTDILAVDPDIIRSIQIPEGYECTFWYSRDCTGQTSYVLNADARLIRFWPGSFKCGVKFL